MTLCRCPDCGTVHVPVTPAPEPNPYRVPDAALRRAWEETTAWEDLRNREYPVDTTDSRKEVR